MKYRRDLIIVALATFCLTSTLFMAVASRSADSPNWDPWADIKEDGTVDIYDAITLANAFGSSGDTPKNVNVTNWPTNKLAYNISTSIPAGDSLFSPWIPVDGYSKISICIYNYITNNEYVLMARHSGGVSDSFYIAEIGNVPTGVFHETYDVPNQEIRVMFINYDGGSRALSLDIYLIV